MTPPRAGPKERTACPVCDCPDCTCGEDCQCTVGVCQCQASSVLDSLGKRRKSCCTEKKKVNDNEDLLFTPQSSSFEGEVQTVNLAVVGMTCGMCAQSIERCLLGVKGVIAAKALPATDEAVVEISPSISVQAIVEEIEAIGYEVPSWKMITEAQTNKALGAAQKEARIEIDGMTCSMCIQTIERALNDLSSAIKQVSIDLSTDTATVIYTEEDVTLDDIIQTIEDVGYTVGNKLIRDVQSQLDPESNHNTTAPARVDDVDNFQAFTDRQGAKVRRHGTAFAWSCVGAAPILMMTMILPHILPHDHVLYHHVSIWGRPFQIQSLIILGLATPVQFIAGWSFYHMAYFNIMSGRLGMDVLVALGTTASYLYAILGLLEADDQSAHFMETSASLICFVLLGKFLQAVAVRRTSQALAELLKLQAKTAIVVTPAAMAEASKYHAFDPLTCPFAETEVPISELQTGAIVKVIRGASIPADCVVVAGDISVDESMVTGESLPLLKTPGSVVLGGTTCVDVGEQGAAFCRVTGVGSQTALAQIVRLIQEAQLNVVPIQTFADRISAVFVPTVISIGLVTYMTWFALCSSRVVPEEWYEEHGETITTFSLKFAIACLVISCPCALGLATPTAVMVGTGVGAKVGVLLKGGEALEVGSNVDSVLFDKTGTLSVGKPGITDWINLSASGEMSDADVNRADSIKSELLWKLASLERTSEHPLAKAVVEYAESCLGNQYLEERPLIHPTSFRSHIGRGASGIVNETDLSIGNRAFFLSVVGTSIPIEAEVEMARLEEEGKTAILASTNKEVKVVIGLADRLKPDAIQSISYLRSEMNVDIWMVTGDNRRTAAAIGKKLDIPPHRIISEALPAAKVQKVRQLQNEGRIVAMVGDGVNDSPVSLFLVIQVSCLTCLIP